MEQRNIGVNSSSQSLNKFLQPQNSVNFAYYRNASPRSAHNGKNKNTYLNNTTLHSSFKQKAQQNLNNNNKSSNSHSAQKDVSIKNKQNKHSKTDSDCKSNKSNKEQKEEKEKEQESSQTQNNENYNKQDKTVQWKELLEQVLSSNFDERYQCDQIYDDVMIMTTICDLENQRVVRADVERTRGSDVINKDHLELILTLYCKRNDIKYKQGMNEVLAPFLHIQKLHGLQLHYAFNFFSVFIWRYMTTIYLDDEFLTLQAALCLLQLLLKYHDPELAIFITINQITPEMYATPWFITYFANKLDLQILIKFWNYILQEDNQDLIFYFSVALLTHNKTKILGSETSNLPQILSTISIDTEQELDEIWIKSQKIKENTPFSFKEMNDLKFIFSLEFQKLPKDMQIAWVEKLEDLPCLPIMVEELFFYSYPDILSCSNPKCQNSLNQYRTNSGSFINLTSQDSFKRQSLASEDKEIQQRIDAQEPQQRRMTTGETIKSQTFYGKKANIHELIKQELIQRQMSDQESTRFQSPQKIDFNEKTKGIDLSSQRSPFKNMNKQMQAKADGMPLETDSNVNDDATELQESHIELINETARMKHLAEAEELKQVEQQTENKKLAQEPKIGNSPKAQLSQYLNQNPSGPGSSMTNRKARSPNADLQFSQLKQRYPYYERGLQSSAQKLSKQNNNHLFTNSRHSQVSNTTSTKSSKLGYCSKCQKRKTYQNKSSTIETKNTNEDESHDYYYEKIRFLVVDCRLESLQKEALLPNSLQFQIKSEVNREYLQSLTNQLSSCKDVYHICLMGLEQMQQKFASKIEANDSETNLDIAEYHEKIIRFLVENFQSSGFKHISVMPGGFQECHEIASRYGFQILNHEKGSCYHCEQTSSNKRARQYNQQFNLVGFSDIFNGFKHWYNIANTKLKNFVKGPIKILGNNQDIDSDDQILKGPSSGMTRQIIIQQNIDQDPQIGQSFSNPSSIYQSLVVSNQSSESRNQGPTKQSRHQHKTTDDQNKLPDIANQLESNSKANPALTPIKQQDAYSQQKDRYSEVSLASFPASLTSQSSRQETVQNFSHTGSNCSSNVSVSSSQNDGNNLRDAISNKKIMSYKLSNKVPGDRNTWQEDTSSQKDLDNLNVVIPSPNGKLNEEDSKEEEKQRNNNEQSNAESNNQIKVELQQNSNSQQRQQKEQQLKLPQSNNKRQQNDKNTGKQQEYYSLNGIIQGKDLSKEEFENIIGNKNYIIFKAHKLHIKKKNEISNHNQSYAYPTYIVITQCNFCLLIPLIDSVSIIKEVNKNKSLNNHNSNPNNELSLTQIDEWDSRDFDELHPSLKVENEMKQQVNQQFAVIESRFLMHDLIKITSRKSSAKIITFYFRIPLYSEYDSKALEENLINSMDQKPAIKYTFAFKRKNYQEVSMSFEFSKEDEAKSCISNVSTIYKKLKNKKSQ